MKKIRISLCLILILGILGAMTAAASSVYFNERVQSIPSVRIVLETENLQAGDELLSDAMSIVSVDGNEYYELIEASWLDTVDHVRIGETPRIRLYLSAIPKTQDYTNYSKVWLFRGGYSTSNVHVTRGSLVQATVQDNGYILEVTVKMNAIRGSFSAPESVTWDTENGIAYWVPSEYGDSGLYDVYCQRNGSTVKKLLNYTGTSYNFYPYMTKEGDYTVKVRCAVPSSVQGQGAKNSEYTESNGLYITSDQVSDGSGQTHDDENGSADVAYLTQTSAGTAAQSSSAPGYTNTSSGIGSPVVSGSPVTTGTSTQVTYNANSASANGTYPNGTGSTNLGGWIVKEDNGTYFRYPNGTYAGAGWMKLNGSWYFLDSKGKRLTGWQKDSRTNWWYYMDPGTGIMKTGWLRDNGYWYYLDPTQGSLEGRMITGWAALSDKKYYFNQNGIMVTGWYQVDGKWYYFWPEGSRTDGTYGYMAVNTTIGDFRLGADGTWQN